LFLALGSLLLRAKNNYNNNNLAKGIGFVVRVTLCLKRQHSSPIAADCCRTQ